MKGRGEGGVRHERDIIRVDKEKKILSTTDRASD